MSNRKWKLLLASPTGCRVMAFSTLGICLFAVINNIYHISGGYIASFSELISCFGKDEIGISIIGIYFFFAFMYAAKNAKKMRKEQRRNGNREVEAPYEGVIARFEEKQKMKPLSYTMGSGIYQISFLVPPTYSWDAEAETNEELGYVLSPVMMHENGGMANCCYNVATEEEIREDAYSHPEELVQEDFELLSKKTQENTKIKQLVVDGKYVVYYYIARYKKGRDKFQTIYAACELELGKVFEFALTYASWEYKVTEQDMEPFFCFQ